ncbi:MAG: DMT family transporter, partial [Chloroflexota bacterium]|nr:DMT family transporter [Chloroflexota bacterium]
MGAAEWAMLGLLALLWGGSFVFAEVALRDLPPLSVVLGRVGLAALVLHAVVLASGARMPPLGAAWGPFLLMGLLNNAIPFALIVWGQTRIGAGLASILNATTPLFTVLVAHVLTRDEKLSGNRLGGVLLGLAGVAVTIGPAALGGLGGNLTAQLAVLGAALSYA